MKTIGPNDPIPDAVATGGELHQEPGYHPFEMNGYAEEFLGVEFNEFLGMRFFKECPEGRLLGSAGRIVYDLTEPIELVKGYKKNVVRASKKRPIKVATMIQIIGGRAKPLPNDVEMVEEKRAEIDLNAPRMF